MNLALWLARVAQVSPENPALFLGDRQVADYAAFNKRAGQVAAWLSGQGIAPGDRVAIFMKNVPDFLVALFGIWSAGAVAVPINSKLHGREAAWIIENAGADRCFVTPDLAEALKDAGVSVPLLDVTSTIYAETENLAPLDVPVSRASDDLAWLFYTSGTTGRPKGVMITHGMLMTMTMCYLADVDTVKPDHATLYAAPMSHAAGIYSLMFVLMGARHICPVSGAFEPAEIFELARRFDNVQMFAAPTMVKRLTSFAKSNGATAEGLRSIVYAGGPMYEADIIEAVDYFGPIFLQVYGQGESPMCITALSRADIEDRSHPRWRERLNSVGRAQSLVEVRIGDADGAAMPPDEVGEIMVRGDAVMPGYWQNPDSNKPMIKES